ncbi:MAG: AI-2E family transporter [Acidimicrobiales bacterium]
MATTPGAPGDDDPAGAADTTTSHPIEPVIVRFGHDAVPGWVKRSIALFWLGWLVVFYGTGALRSLRSLLIVLLISLFLSFAIEPAVNRFERLGIRRGIGTWIMFIVILAMIAGFSAAVGTALATQVTEFVDQVPDYIDDIESWVNDTFNADADFEELRQQFVQGGGAQDLASRFADDLVNLGATVIGIIFQAFTIALFTFYLVAEGPKLRRTVCSLLDEDRQRLVLQVWDLAIEKTGGYIYSRTILAIISSVAHWIAFSVIGVPFPLPLALWVGVISQFIPVIGTYIAGALPLLISLLDSPGKALWTLGTIVVYQQLENYLFSPRITAHTMEIHVATAFGAVIAGGALLGIVGALLALPFAATVQAFVSTYFSHHEVHEATLAESRTRRGLTS